MVDWSKNAADRRGRRAFKKMVLYGLGRLLLYLRFSDGVFALGVSV